MTERGSAHKYGFGTTVAGSYEDTVERTRAALKTEGFGILTEIDVRRTMKEKLDVEFRPYLILGACNPPLAHQDPPSVSCIRPKVPTPRGRSALT